MKAISPAMHGVLDYSTMAATLSAPKVLDFPAPAARATYALAAGYLAMSALTDYPPALRRRIPFTAHGKTDMMLGLALPAVPWLLGFSKDKRARNFFLALTGVTLLVTALTDWSADKRSDK